MTHRRRARKTRDFLSQLARQVSGETEVRRARGRLTPMTALHRASIRRSLNPIVFPRRLYTEGLSLAALLSMPEEVLVGVIPDYKGLRHGDILTALIHNRESHKTHVAGALCVCDGAVPLSIHYTREMLEQFDVNGRCDFAYEIRSAAGEVSLRSPPSTLKVKIRDMPERLPAPVIVCGEDGVVRERDIVPQLVVEIPASWPACKAGDCMRLRMGDAWFAPMSVEVLDAGLDPMARLLISCDDVLRMVAEQGDEPFTLEASYDVERQGVFSPSDIAVVAFDLSGSSVA
ncbi:MAG: hypothetical protein WBW32_13580 [Luteibacter sp.]